MEMNIEVREPVLTYLKILSSIFHADACVLYDYIYEMHPEEKKKDFLNRFEEKIIINNEEYKYTDVEKYSILKFIGVGEQDDEKNWNLLYSERPDKYVIFEKLVYPEHIEKEGLTGYTARTGLLKYYPENSIIKSTIRNQQNDDTQRSIHPPCKECIVIPIKYNLCENSIRNVVLRLDIYKDSKNQNFNEDYIKLLINEDVVDENITLNDDSHFYNYMCESIRIIFEQSESQAVGKTYSDLYKGSKLIDPLTEDWFLKIYKNMQKEKPGLNIKFYEKITHLFFVLNRRTYLGEDHITNRVIAFADDIWKLMDIDNTFSFSKQLEMFKKHEQLMLYDSASYRDHFMHQMHVFVLGYIIINAIGFKCFTKQLNDAYRNCSPKKNKNMSTMYNDMDITEDLVLKIWFLTAFFHDISYIIEKLPDRLSKFINKLFDNKIDFHILGFRWDQIVSKTDYFTNFLHALSNQFYLPKDKLEGSTTKFELLSYYYEKIITKQDHGIFSAMYLLHNLSPEIKDEYKFEVIHAAFAISLHNSIYRKIKSGTKNGLHFLNNPIEVLLLFCDCVQEWGRIRNTDNKTHLSPELFSFEKFELNNELKQISITIKYREKYNIEIATELEEFISKTKNRIEFGVFSFNLIYLFENNVMEKSFY